MDPRSQHGHDAVLPAGTEVCSSGQVMRNRGQRLARTSTEDPCRWPPALQCHKRTLVTVFTPTIISSCQTPGSAVVIKAKSVSGATGWTFHIADMINMFECTVLHDQCPAVQLKTPQSSLARDWLSLTGNWLPHNSHFAHVVIKNKISLQRH